jgi:hypothetical protein
MDEQRLPGTSQTDGAFFEDATLARRFQRRLDEVRPPADEGRGQILYDESGYPLDDHPLGLTGRLRRLITG